VTTARRFEKVLVANRGEIALRVFRALRELGIGCVAVYSEVDREALHVQRADEAYLIGPGTPSESYLHVDRVIEAARRAGADAIHPGYGFLAENAGFAQRCVDEGIAWIGPPPSAIEAMGSKIRARRVMADAGVPIVPGGTERVTTVGRVLDLGAEYGWPIALKAAAGGGGRGLRVVSGPDDAERALEAAQREGQAYFGDPAVYVERYLEDPRHIEVQVMADQHGAVIALGERDCTLQRRHQKIVEEAPSPAVTPPLRVHLGEMGVAAARAVRYVGAGTVECLMDRYGNVFFLEMNTRIQVEHTITEAVTGIDLVREQVRVAMGEPLSFGRRDVVMRGHAIECRINAEDPVAGYRPSPGRVTRYREPSGPGVRVDSALAEGGEVVALYDPMVAKVVVWDRDRDAARARMRRALDEMVVEGVRTLIPLHRLIMESPEFARGETCAGFVEDVWPRQLAEMEDGEDSGAPGSPAARDRARTYVTEVDGKRFEVVVHAPEPAALTEARERLAARGSAHETHDGAVASPMQGTVLAVRVEDGQAVEQDDVLLVVEAMKMENEILAPRAGVVRGITVAAGDAVSAGKLLCQIVDAAG
jgi:acetyl-CoA/propionyl-CoA/long-chain acyl-CoA carboxylase, biotin carboxylase, biotin carboxyl carrier protein